MLKSEKLIEGRWLSWALML